MGNKDNNKISGTSMDKVVDHPEHYGGVDNPYEAIKVIEAWTSAEASYGFCIGNALKYICRAGKKDGSSIVQDLRKAIWYLERACNLSSDKFKIGW